MNNQAAQTMPELPEKSGRATIKVSPGKYQTRDLYTADQVHKYARDYAAMLAAAPAASGGESAASVSERARELLAAEYERANFPDIAKTIREGGYHWDSIRALELRAIEQALTQQRGAASYDAGMAMHWIERYAAGIDEECQLDRIAEAFTTPQPSADAVREVPDGMVLVPREPTDGMIAAICQAHAGRNIWPTAYGGVARMIRREHAITGYRALLSAASGEKGVGK